jgi:hypothetical protein
MPLENDDKYTRSLFHHALLVRNYAIEVKKAQASETIVE